MKKRDQLFFVNRICDAFESELKAGAAANIERTLESAQAEVEYHPSVANDLLPELIALQITYSENRDATVESLKATYPDHVIAIENARYEPSLYATIKNANTETGFEERTRPAPAKSFARIGKRFEKLEYLASGGLGDVYTGFDKSVKRPVAIKFLKSHLVAIEEAKRRFQNEAAITGGLEHPGIVPIYDSGISDDGRPYYVMRFFRGRTMKDDIRELHSNREAVDFSEKQRGLIRRLADVSKAISYAHDNDVIHRDLKPANILLGDYGESIVIDWGLAKRGMDTQVPTSDNQVLPEDLSPINDEASLLTRAGTVLGTPGYMSPEQAAGDQSRVGRPTDIYSLGSVLHTIITGAPADDSQASDGNSKTSSDRRQHDKSPRAMKSSVLQSICARSMNQDPSQRYPDVRSFGTDLENWLNDLPVVAKPDTLVDRSARFFRKNRTWSLIAAATLLAITIGSLAVASAFKTRSVKLGQLQQQTLTDAEIQKDLAKANLEIAERERVTGVKLRNRLGVLESYIRLSVQENGNFSKETLQELVLDRISNFKKSKEISPPIMMEHVNAAVNALSLITDHESALSTYQEFSELRESLLDGSLSEQVYTAVEESKLFLAVGKAEEARLALEPVKTDAINELGLDHDATQNLLRQYLKSLRDRFSSKRAAAVCSAYGGVREGCGDISLRTTEVLYPWLVQLEKNGVPDPFGMEELKYGSLYAWDLCSSGDVKRGSLIFQKLYEKASGTLGATEVHSLASLQVRAEAMLRFGDDQQALAANQLLAGPLGEEYGPSHGRTLVVQIQVVRLLLNIGSFSDALELVRDIQKKDTASESLWPKDLLYSDVLLAKALLLAGKQSEATEVLDRLFAKEYSGLGSDQAQLKKSYELEKKTDRLVEVVNRIQEAVEETEPIWDPYFPLTVPE